MREDLCNYFVYSLTANPSENYCLDLWFKLTTEERQHLSALNSYIPFITASLLKPALAKQMLADVDPQYAQMMLVSGLAYALAHADLEYAANVWKMARFGQWTIIMPEFGAFLEGIGHSGGADAATWIQKRQQGLLQTQTHVNEFKEAVKQSPPNVVQVKSIWREASQQTRDEILITYCLFCKTVDEVTDYLAYTPQTTPVMTEMLNRHHGYGPNSMATHPSARPEAIYSSHSAKTYPQPAYNSK